MSDEPKELRDSVTPDEPAIADLPPESLDAQVDESIKGGGKVAVHDIPIVHYYDKSSPTLG